MVQPDLKLRPKLKETKHKTFLTTCTVFYSHSKSIWPRKGNIFWISRAHFRRVNALPVAQKSYKAVTFKCVHIRTPLI